MLGTKLFKDNAEDMKRYTELAMWCNENGYTIEDKGDFYECVELPEINITDLPPTLEERVRELEEKNEMLNDVLISLIFNEEK